MSATNSASGSKNNSMPTTITLSTFTAARIKEIQAMRKNIMESRSTKLAFQKLPKHMRRRTMSHVVKRLPRRLRQIHMNQMQKAGLPPKNNRGSRKYRRRPLNLQSEYARRQRRVKWLNTHLWHAKRFHMIEKWGYKLPKQPCDKSFRACYRATTQHCLVQDMSYVKCIELNGSYEDIMSQLEKMVDIRTGLTFKALCFREGKKFGELTLFEPAVNSYERKAIGQIKYLWNQYADGRKLLWLFVHAAFYKQMVTLFIKLFNFELLKENELKTITYKSPQGVILKELEYELDTISLTGSLAIDILKIALRTVELTEKHQDMLRNCTRKFLIKQNQVFDNLSKESHIPPNMVLSITVNDPRLNFPTKRTKALLNSCTPNDDDFDELQSNLSFSPLFDERVRNLIKTNRVSNEEICKLREKNLIPGSELELKNETLIPLILLWRPGNKEKENNGYSSGWDIIVPSNWSQTFFLAFVMWGARAGGLRETESIAFERSQPDILYPDTIAGEEEERDISQLYREKYFRLPPNKRTNFNKFGILSPISFNWNMLLSEWTFTSVTSFSVLRDKKILKQIQEFLTTKTPKPMIPENVLVPVKVAPIKNGVCCRFDIICFPTKIKKNVEPTEPICKDVNVLKRKLLRKEHKALLKRLHRRRKRSKKLGIPITSTDVNILNNYTKEIRKLWLPETETIRYSCSQEVIGFIKHGAFSFTHSRMKGLGYIASGSLNALATLSQRNKILIRNTHSRQYRLAVLNVVTEL